MIVAGPGVSHGRCATPVTTWDAAATIVEAGRTDFPEQHPTIGRSLRNIASEGDSSRIIVSQNGYGPRRWIMGTDGITKFIHWYNGDEEIYDLSADPLEQENLAQSESFPELRDACISFEREHGEPGYVNDSGFVDTPTGEPHAQSHSIFPDWSSFQLPPWALSQVPGATAKIASQMKSCMSAPGSFTGNHPVWRERACRYWDKAGGDRLAYDELFRACDEPE
jgi:hypothetical protein